MVIVLCHPLVDIFHGLLPHFDGEVFDDRGDTCQAQAAMESHVPSVLAGCRIYTGTHSRRTHVMNACVQRGFSRTPDCLDGLPLPLREGLADTDIFAIDIGDHTVRGASHPYQQEDWG